MTPNAYSYVRMSTEAQLGGDSFRRQMETSKIYAEKHGLNLIEDFSLEDIGVSAFNGQNVNSGALGKFLEAVKTGVIPAGSYLLVESLDRLSRQKLELAASLFLNIVNSGVIIVTLIDGQVYKAGQLEFGKLLYSLVTMQRANEESQTKSTRLSAAWSQKRKNILQKKLTSRCPAWLRLSTDRTTFEIDVPKAEIVRQIFKDAAAGKGSHIITKELNRAMIKPLAGASVWSQSYVTKILNSRAVLGEFQPHAMQNGKRQPRGEPIPDYFPRIISDELFLLVRAARRSRAANQGGRRGENQTNLFTHLLRCEYCGGRLRYVNKGFGPKGGQYLRCVNSFNGNGCSTKGWSYADFEKTFLTFVREVDLRSIMTSAKQIKEGEKMRSALTAAREQKSILSVRIDRTYEQISKQPALEDYLLEKMVETKEEISRLEQRIAEIESQLKGEKFDDATEEELASLVSEIQAVSSNANRFALSAKVRQIVERITVAVDGKRWRNDELRLIRSQDEAFANWELLLNHIERMRQESELNKPYMHILLRNNKHRLIVPDPTRAERLIANVEIDNSGALAETAVFRMRFGDRGNGDE
jgi:DNA invertase Pin-like site-specific DNA recombinase